MFSLERALQPTSDMKGLLTAIDTVSKVDDHTVDVILANLEDGVPASDKEAARAGLVDVAKTTDFGDTQFWTRVNSLDSPWGLDDLMTAVTKIAMAPAAIAALRTTRNQPRAPRSVARITVALART